MDEIYFRVVAFVAIWLPVIGAFQIITAYKRNRYRKHPKLKEYRWGIVNCVGSLLLYSYLIVKMSWVAIYLLCISGAFFALILAFG
jgi:hypothetical protein